MSDQDYHHAARERRQAAEEDYARAMGEYLARTLEADRSEAERDVGSIFDAVGRAKVAKGNLEGGEE